MRQNGFASLFLVLIVVIAVGAGAYYFGTKNSNQTNTPQAETQNISQTPLETESPSLSPTPTEATKSAATLIYYNPANEFSFKYPKTWKVTYNENSAAAKPFETGVTYISYLPKPVQGIIEDGIVVDISNLKEISGQTTMQEELTTFVQIFKTSGSSEKLVFTPKNVGKQSGYIVKIDSTEITPGQNYLNRYLIGTEGNGKRLYITVTVSGNEELYMKSLDQILTSFTFQ
jgi:hypothetical protein